MSGSDLVLDLERSVRVAGGSDAWSIELGHVRGGVRVEGAGVYFRLNSGNVVQFGTELLGDVRIDPVPTLSREAALAAALARIGAPAEAVETVVDPGTLRILPTLVPGESAGGEYAGPAGEGYRHRLVWDLTFVLADDPRTLRVAVDAHDGEVLRVADRNVHATVTGGIYPTTNTDPEEIRGLPFANVTNNGAEDHRRDRRLRLHRRHGDQQPRTASTSG